MHKLLIFFCVLGLVSPAVAQETTSATDTRTALATEIVDDLLPDGFYRRMMDDMMGGMMDQMMAGMMGMSPADMGVPMSDEERAEAEGKTLGELAAAEDPHFVERMKITMDVTMGEMTELMDALEPQVKSALTAIYARRFDEATLADTAAFFDTPSGQKFAAEYMTAFMDPEMMQAMQAAVPEIMQAMPAIMQKVEAATAHLPPPPRPDGEAAAEAESY